MRRYLLDFTIMNLIALIVSLFASLVGKGLVNTFILILFFESGLVLILGGLFGFLLTSVSFQALRRFLRGIKVVSDLKDKTGEKRSMGNRFIILGAALLLESISLALAMM